MPMMTYDPFWRMMDERRISTYSLEVDYGFNKAFIYRLKHNKNMTLSSIDYICDVFSCSVEDVVVHIGIKEAAEAGRSGSRIETLIRIAVTLGVSLDSLTDISEADEKYRFQQEAAYLLFRDKTVNELKYVIAVVDSIFKYKQEFLD